MKQPSTATAKQPKPGLKMKELTDATGMSKSTILYYLSLGLIPGPTKTSPNMAYYDPECIPRIRFIQNMQRRHRLSLSEIRQLMEQWGDEAPIAGHLELTDLVFGLSPHEDLMDRKTFLDATGLNNQQVEALIGAELIIPLEENRFDRHDVVMGKALAQGLAWGFKIEDLTFYVETGKKIVAHEMALRPKLTRNLPLPVDAAMTLEMVKSARVSRAYVIDRLFQKRVAAMKDLKDEGPDGDSDPNEKQSDINTGEG